MYVCINQLLKLNYFDDVFFCIQEPASALHLEHMQRCIRTTPKSCWYRCRGDGSLGEGACCFPSFAFIYFLIRKIRRQTNQGSG